MVTEIIGWVGVLLILTAYFLVSLKKIKSDSINFHLLNLLGASGVVIDTYLRDVYSVMFLNIVWFVIALYGIIKSRKIK